MKKHPATPGNDPIDAFFDAPPKQIVHTIDRSDLEWWSTCPHSAAEKMRGKVNTSSDIANAGNEGFHAAASKTIIDYLELNGHMNRSDIIESMQGYLLGSRPDVQPDAIRGGRASVWKFSTMLAVTHPDSILAFDGGEEVDRSGQLSHDIDFGVVKIRITSELDFLVAGPSVDCPHESDWKTGHKHWTATLVKESFQFQCHAVLVMKNYEEIQAIRVVAWNTRMGTQAHPVEFKRIDLDKFVCRMRSAAGEFYKYLTTGQAETWPSVEKCAICPVAAKCPAAGEIISEVAADPVAALEVYHACKVKLAELKKLLTAHVDKEGTIVSEELGLAFGRDKPPSEKKVTATDYELPKENDDDDHASSN